MQVPSDAAAAAPTHSALLTKWPNTFFRRFPFVAFPKNEKQANPSERTVPRQTSSTGMFCTTTAKGGVCFATPNHSEDSIYVAASQPKILRVYQGDTDSSQARLPRASSKPTWEFLTTAKGRPEAYDAI
jgi:hypothetical protein